MNIKEKLNGLNKMFGDVKAELDELCKSIGFENKEKEQQQEKLMLELGKDGELEIRYCGELIGFITTEGEVHILSWDAPIECYEQWRDDGVPVDSSVIEWRGGRYKIAQNFFLLRVGIHQPLIYDFSECVALPGCNDNNIRRFEHNNRPILF